ncbi:PH domain-containing protein [Streptomyces sp. RB6PN25]|uniref:PH domain-containing protein n=1 Tax=Streptomyces humicola TaxID=2953240 RepID=A0ABT1Q417_9ACTN|nr:PH domain-containing protein [Streptomyces humicola]MCQ4083525.1 PH domain-containing protein [Streptomyces humicola]
MNHEITTAYEDGGILCDDQGLTIRRYYPWGAKRIRYSSIQGVEKLPLTGVNKVRKWRIWGSGDFLHWWNLDPQRPRKDVALVIDIGHRVRPTITPDDPGAVERILAERSTDR